MTNPNDIAAGRPLGDSGSASKLSDDEMKKLIEGIDLDAISRRVAEHMAFTAEKYRQACVVSAIANLNLHICALASCNSVVAGMARLKAEEDRRSLIAELAYRPNAGNQGLAPQGETNAK